MLASLMHMLLCTKLKCIMNLINSALHASISLPLECFHMLTGTHCVPCCWCVLSAAVVLPGASMRCSMPACHTAGPFLRRLSGMSGICCAFKAVLTDEFMCCCCMHSVCAHYVHHMTCICRLYCWPCIPTSLCNYASSQLQPDRCRYLGSPIIQAGSASCRAVLCCAVLCCAVLCRRRVLLPCPC
jgi:hypothetical protein